MPQMSNRVSAMKLKGMSMMLHSVHFINSFSLPDNAHFLYFIQMLPF